jgi:hypothetical protein
VERLRLVKSPAEVEHHRRAGELAAAGLDAGLAAARAGATELEIKGASIAAVLTEGARRCPILAVAAAGNALVGERIAAVHAPAGARPAKPGEPVFVVLSASAEGAHCELSRTIVVGDAPSEETPLVPAGRALTRRRGDGRCWNPGERARPGGAQRAARGCWPVPPDADRARLGLAPGGAEPRRRGRDAAPAGMVISIEPGVCIPAPAARSGGHYVVRRPGEPTTTYPIEDVDRGAATGAAGTDPDEEETTMRRECWRSNRGNAGPARRTRAGGIGDSGAEDGHLRDSLEPPTVDPAIEVAGPGYRVLVQLYEGL